MLVERDLIKRISQWLKTREVMIIYGARQVGKSTLLHQLLDSREDALILNCELPTVADVLSSRDPARVEALFEDYSIIALDEAQSIQDIGSALKIIFDEMPQYKIITTGSSSFEISNKILEPLTGRNIKLKLYPLSLNELRTHHNWYWVNQHLKELLVLGSYPGLLMHPLSLRQEKLSEITSDYLFKDILVYEGVKSPALIRQLLKALALQVGQLVSTNELSNMLRVSRPLIEKYLDLLEKSFVIFRLSSYGSNLRNEIKKSSKYYFYDLGIRNALIGNFVPFENRTDQGALWENFCIVERLKWQHIHQPLTNFYFWRTYDGAEIDLVEEYGGEVNAFEFKWKLKRKVSINKLFAAKYPVKSFRVIHAGNLDQLLK